MRAQRLVVPGAWLAACGFGDKDRSFVVTGVEHNTLPSGRTATMVSVDRDGAPWVVYMEMRGARFVDADLVEAALEEAARTAEPFAHPSRGTP